MSELPRKAERAGGQRQIIDVRQLRTSQYDHTTHTFTKKALSQRQYMFGDGRGRVQRPLQRVSGEKLRREYAPAFSA